MAGHWGQLEKGETREAIPLIGCEMSYSFWSAGGAVVPWDRLEPFSGASAPADRGAFPDALLWPSLGPRLAALVHR